MALMHRSILTATLSMMLSVVATRTFAADDWSFTDIEGRVHRPFASSDTKAAAFVFITPDCPVANFYQPTLRDLAKEYRARGIPFFFVHSDPSVTVTEARQHVKKFEIAVPVLLDADQKLARRLGATITPEAAVFDPQGEILYRGRIDDWYVGVGNKRRAAQTHDLKDALEAVASGKKVVQSRTKAIGCHIPFEDHQSDKGK